MNDSVRKPGNAFRQDRPRCPSRRRMLGTSAGILVASMLDVRKAWAQDWPTHTITFVVPYPPGGGTDPVARVVADELSKRLGQTVVVDNRSGASGNIGTAWVARAAPDGYTLLFGAPGPLINSKFLFKDLPYDPAKDFDPISKLVESPLVLVTRADLPINDVRELAAYVKANPGHLNVGVVGLGSTLHMLELMLASALGTSFNIVPFRGSGQVMAEMLAGRIDLNIDYPTQYLPHVAAGKLRLLATLGERRGERYPNLPTVAESGFPNVVATGWFGMLGPRGMPADVVRRLHAEVVEVLKTDSVKQRLDALGYAAVSSSPEALGSLIASEQVRIGKVIRDNHVTME